MTSHILASILARAGPLLAMVGAVLLAYDAFQAPMRFHMNRHFKGRAEGIKSVHNYLIGTFPSPPYTQTEVENEKMKLEEKLRAELSALQSEADASELEYRLTVSNLALCGFILVAIGSFAQAVVAFLSL